MIRKSIAKLIKKQQLWKGGPKRREGKEKRIDLDCFLGKKKRKFLEDPKS